MNNSPLRTAFQRLDERPELAAEILYARMVRLANGCFARESSAAGGDKGRFAGARCSGSAATSRAAPSFRHVGATCFDSLIGTDAT